MKGVVFFACLILGCGGATEAADGAAAAEWRCLPITSSGASISCDADAGATCDCPTSCTFKGAAGSCVP